MSNLFENKIRLREHKTVCIVRLQRHRERERSIEISKIILSSALNQVGMMELFALLRQHYRILGISPVQNVRTRAKNCLASLFIVHISITCLVYLITEAKSIPDYVDSFYMFTTATTNAFSFVVTISNMTHIFCLIENLEKVIEQRNQQAIYIKLKKKIELFSKIFHFVHVPTTTIGVVLPILLMSFFFYIITDSGSDAFQLPFLAS